MMALNSGVQGVLVCGCKPGECHFKRGTYIANCKLNLLDTMLNQFNYSKKQIRFIQIGTQERGRIRYEIDAMLKMLDKTLEAI
jgi:F420-non-reducing hydrogenase iron-sulfur subunit